MNFRGIRSSKFRHVYGLPVKKEKCYENIRLTRNAQDGHYCAVNPKFLAVVVEVGGGGSFVVLPLEKCGRVDYNVWKVTGHAGPVLDVKWNPFNDNIIASASEDCQIRVWYIPDGGLSSDMGDSLVQLTGHRRKVGIIEWHPTAENILVSAGYDHMVIVWNVAKSVPVNIINCHTDTIFSMSFNRNGSLLATTCKDKKLRIVDPRSGQLIKEGKSHHGTKASKVVYLGASGKLFTTGFSKFSDRQYGIWSEKDLSQPLKMETIDSSSGILTPYYDQDTNMVYVAGKGDGNVRYYEVLNVAPWASFLNQFITGAPQKGFGILPKRGIDVTACELFRMYKLHATKDVVEPISMIVPRKSNTFQEDVYPETAAPSPALTADEWLQGKNAWPVLISMKTGGQTKTYKPVMYKNSEQAIVISDKNNDRKFMFLSEETNPDYRQVDKCKDTKPRTEAENHLYGADKQQTKKTENRPKNINIADIASEKDIKTSLNLGTKFQQVQNKFSDNSYDSPDINLDLNTMYKASVQSGSNSVKLLTTKFDYRDNKEVEDSEVELKRVVNEQKKLISNLKDQVEVKERRIQELEMKVKLMIRNNPPSNMDNSLNNLNEQSVA